jgi:hypothetical protein
MYKKKIPEMTLEVPGVPGTKSGFPKSPSAHFSGSPPYAESSEPGRHRRHLPAPELQQERVGTDRKFSDRSLHEIFSTGLSLDNFKSVIDKTGQLDTKYLFSGKSFVRNVQEKRSRKL